MDTCFEMGSCLARTRMPKSIQETAEGEEKASYSSQIPEMSRHPWEARAMETEHIVKEELMIGCPGRIKYHITLRNVICMFPLERWVGGCGPRKSAGCRAEGTRNLFFPSLSVHSGYPRLPEHLDQDTSKRRPLFCSLHSESASSCHLPLVWLGAF